jgi:PKD domain-containing protein/K319-like protein
MVSRKRWGHAVAIVVLGLAVMCGPAWSQQFSKWMNVSNNADYSFTPQIAVDAAGNIYVAWEDDTANNSNILFRRSTDGGVTFLPTPAPKPVSNSSGCSSSPVMAVDAAGNINIVWEDSSDCSFGTSNIFFSRSTDGGVTFSTPTNLSATMNTALFSVPQIAVDTAGNINVVWESDTGNLAIWFSGSQDGGATFSSPKMVSSNTGGSLNAQIAVDKNGSINVVWEDDIAGHSDISFSRSTDNGATFSFPMNLSNPLGSCIANSNTPRIGLDAAANINVVWSNDCGSNFDIFLSRSADNGATFSFPKNLSGTPGSSVNPQLFVDAAGNINVVWEESSPADIFFVRSGDAGATFSSAQNLSHNSGASTNARLTVDAGANINVAWEDTTPGNRDILFTRSTDSGATFLSTPLNLSNNSGLSAAVQIAADKSGDINVAWQDSTSGVSQILFSRMTGNVVTNHPPVADAGLDQTVQSTGSGGTTVTLDGSKSSDPDGDVLSFVWKDELGNVVGSTAVVQVAVQVGTHPFTLTVSDPGNLSSSASTVITVQAVNHPPVAVASANQTLQSAGQSMSVTLDGSKSTDPDGDVLSFVWRNELGNVVGTTAVVQVTVQVGVHTFTLTVTDPGNLSSSASTVITVQAVNHPPVAVASADQTLECTGQGMRVMLDGSKSSDPDGDALSFVWRNELGNVVGATAVVQLTPALGTRTFTLTVTDAGGLSSTATTHVTVRDTTAPSLTVTLSPNALWPPNHRLVQVTATVVASDSCDPNPAVALLSITSSEPDDGLGDGDQPNDIQAVGGGTIPFGTDVRSFLLRAERSGMEAGRIYTVTYMVQDASGNHSFASALVTVGSQTTNGAKTRWDRDSDRDSDRKSDRKKRVYRQ